MAPEAIWLATVAALSCGLAYYLWFIIPANEEAKLEGAIRAFGRAVELRFPNHAGLTEVVTKLCRQVGGRMGMRPNRIRQIEMTSRLRDIGLCAIPYRLVNRREWSDWTLSETATYDCHPEVGGAILETIPALSEYAEGVRAHHVPFAPSDDSPDRRSPVLEARIVKACAEFVWFSRHLGKPAAIAHVEGGIGTLYDPMVAHELLRIVKARTDDEKAVTSTLL